MQDSPITLSQSLVEEALIVSDLFKLNELSALQLLLHGEEQLPQYPGLTRGLVAVVLYYDGRKALVQALKILMSGRPGLTWSSEAPEEIGDLVLSVTGSLMETGLTERILTLLSTLDWTADLAALQRNAALGKYFYSIFNMFNCFGSTRKYVSFSIFLAFQETHSM